MIYAPQRFSSSSCGGSRRFVFTVLVVLSGVSAALAVDEPVLEPFGPSGERIGVEQPGVAETWVDRDAEDFLPNVQVDDGVNPEHREPAVVWGPGGQIYAIYSERATHWNPELVMFTKSTDGGATWRAPAIRVNDTDPNAVIFPAIDVLPDGTILAVWNEMEFDPYNNEIRFASSDDGGESWSASVVVHPIDPSQDYYRPSVVVAGNRIVVSFFREITYPNGQPVVVYSDDGGASWAGPIVVTAIPSDYGGSAPCIAWNEDRGTLGMVVPAQDERILFFQSMDGGVSWSGGVQVSESTGATSVNYPDLASWGGSDYVVWSDNRYGQYDTDIWISRSEDGETFSAGVMVNDDLTGNQYEPHLRIDPSGGVHVCWIWNIPFGMDIDLYYSVSDDGGATWLWPTPRVNDIPYVVQPRVAWTSDLLVDRRGNAYLFWNDGRETGYYDHVYFSSRWVPAAVGEPPGPVAGLGELRILGQPGARPLVRLLLEREVESARIELIDPAGRIVQTLARGGLRAGEHRFAITGDAAGRPIAQGTYFIRLMAGRESVTRRFVVVR